MSIPDNRIKFPSGLINFPVDVGVTGLEHDSYPAPGAQARYDHMRLFLIGLLSNQSSYDEPTNYRDGTLWFDLNTMAYKQRSNGAWNDISSSIKLGETDLLSWYASASATLQNVTSSAVPEMCFFGVVATNSTNLDSISIPVALSDKIDGTTRAFVTLNGDNTDVTKRLVVVSPQNVTIVGSLLGGYVIQLANIILENGDTFCVRLKNIPENVFITDSITVS